VRAKFLSLAHSRARAKLPLMAAIPVYQKTQPGSISDFFTLPTYVARLLSVSSIESSSS
jgi:hypothetical protein